MEKVNTSYNHLGNYQAFNLNNELVKFKQLHDRIERMPNNKEKYWALKNYITYYFFLMDILKKEQFSFEPFDFDTQDLLQKYDKAESQISKNLLNNLNLINRIFSKARQINDQFNLFQKYNLNNQINPQLGLELLVEFFNQMPRNINILFNKVINGNIYNSLTEDNCYAYALSYLGDYKIANSISLNNYAAYFAIAHELGHCYYFELIKGRKFQIDIDSEVPSIFMETLFNLFVDQYLFHQNYGHNMLLNRQSLFASLISCENIILTNSDYCELIEDNLCCNLNTTALTQQDKKF